MADNLPTSIKNLNTQLGNQLAEGGGGGSSDFSTAQVTITISKDAIVYAPFVHYDSLGDCTKAEIMRGGVYDIVLYKGLCRGSVYSDESISVIGTGSVEVTSGVNLIITGDGTITIS